MGFIMWIWNQVDFLLDFFFFFFFAAMLWNNEVENLQKGKVRVQNV